MTATSNDDPGPDLVDPADETDAVPAEETPAAHGEEVVIEVEVTEYSDEDADPLDADDPTGYREKAEVQPVDQPVPTDDDQPDQPAQ